MELEYMVRDDKKVSYFEVIKENFLKVAKNITPHNCMGQLFLVACIARSLFLKLSEHVIVYIDHSLNMSHF